MVPAPRLYTVALIFLFAVNSAGCEYLRAVSFVRDEQSGKTAQTAKLYLIEKSPAGGIELRTHDNELKAALQECGATSSKPGFGPILAAVLVPLAGFAIQQAVDASVDALASEVKELREKSQPKLYRDSVVIDGDLKILGKVSQCLLLVRRENTEGDSSTMELDKAGLILLFGLERREKKPVSFTMPLRYIKLVDAVAVTGEGQPIDLAVAFVGKAAVTDDKGINKVQIFAENTITIPRVKLGSAQLVRKQADPGTSLLALPPEKAERIELIVAVQESGTAVPNAAKAEAELKALGEAVGPALKEQLKTLVATE